MTKESMSNVMVRYPLFARVVFLLSTIGFMCLCIVHLVHGRYGYFFMSLAVTAVTLGGASEVFGYLLQMESGQIFVRRFVNGSVMTFSLEEIAEITIAYGGKITLVLQKGKRIYVPGGLKSSDDLVSCLIEKGIVVTN